MPITPDDFSEEFANIRSSLVDQGHRVHRMAERCFDAVYSRDLTLAETILKDDDEVDEIDVVVEQRSVDLLTRASRDACGLRPEVIRSVLTTVKVNNELERIADAAVSIAQKVISLGDRTTPFPKSLLVMTNSVSGIIRDAVRAFAKRDPTIARSVLASESTVLNFNDLIVRDAEQRVADGRMTVEVAFELHAIAAQAVQMGDHCTNIAEQVIYETTGTVVRHTSSGWVDQNTRAN